MCKNIYSTLWYIHVPQEFVLGAKEFVNYMALNSYSANNLQKYILGTTQPSPNKRLAQNRLFGGFGVTGG
jgi:hypothetical protein